MTAKATRNPIFKKVQGHVLANQVLLRRPGKAEDIGYTALFLASDESSYITGTDIVVDGGWFSSAPYLVSKRSHHALSMMDKQQELEEFLHHFR
jgi:NAD(P)-dependent dehydrogenase (short-subunit alcohol dehydrogenase family)